MESEANIIAKCVCKDRETLDSREGSIRLKFFAMFFVLHVRNTYTSLSHITNALRYNAELTETVTSLPQAWIRGVQAILAIAPTQKTTSVPNEREEMVRRLVSMRLRAIEELLLSVPAPAHSCNKWLQCKSNCTYYLVQHVIINEMRTMSPSYVHSARPSALIEA